MPHIVLLGDSIVDNAAYTNGGLDVISQVSQLLPGDTKATLLAMDGATTEHVSSQLGRMPTDASHLILSVGGNDALMNSGILYSVAASTSQALVALSEVPQGLEGKYRKVVETCMGLRLPLAICTPGDRTFGIHRG